MNELVKKARDFAINAHHNQRRKFGYRRFIYHPARVYQLLREKYGYETDLLCASWLHDTLEDCPEVTFNILAERFNLNVAKLVDEVTHPILIPKPKREKRWKVYLEHYSSASDRGKILKLADRLCNLNEYFDYWEEVSLKERKFIRKAYFYETAELGVALEDAEPGYASCIRTVNFNLYRLSKLVLTKNDDRI